MVYIERDVESTIESWLKEREIIAIRGPRQSGKTTLLKRLRTKLLHKNVDKERVHFISFEDDITRLKFEENPKEFIQFYLDSEKHYFLFDEVQYVNNIGKTLKLLFDTFENIKIIITGSSSFDLTNLGSYLVGRVIFFNLYPFSFHEFLKTKDKKYIDLYNKIRIDVHKKNVTTKKSIFLDDLNTFLHEYLTYGSYPRIVLENNVQKKKILLKNLFTTYIEKDIVAMYGINYREKVVRLLKTLASIYGGMVNYQTLSENSGIKYKEIRNILPLLEDSFVIFIVKPFYKNVTNELRKNPKIYFVDYGLRNYLMEDFDTISFDTLYENFFHNQLKRSSTVKYWRTQAKTEVDFVIQSKKEIIPIEVKTTPKITRSFRSFINHYHPHNAFIMNVKNVNVQTIDETTVYTIPLVYS